MFTLNTGQELIVSKAIEWYYNSNSSQVFQYDGPPGSGKSVVLNEIVRRLNLDPNTEVAAMSFIGAASLVMRMKGLASAKTIHSWIYEIEAVPLKDAAGNVIKDNLLNVPIMVQRFIPVEHLPAEIKLIIIDEAYSMPLKLRPDVEKFGIKIIACGDQNQLPPVNDFPAYLANGQIYHLTESMRQLGREDISFIANRVGQGLPLFNGYYGNSLVINRSDLTDDMLLWADVIICSKNSTRDEINSKIRSILGYNSQLPKYGEKVVCRNNNWLTAIELNNGWKINLVNGLIGKVISNPDISTFDGQMFSMSFKPDMVNAAFFQLRCNYKHMISDSKARSQIRNNRYEKGNMFEYAYAITTHVSQGSQFHNVVYIEEPMHPSIQNNLNLVGASRADRALIYVKKD